MTRIDDEYADLLRQYRDRPTPELRDRLHARYVALREAELLGGTTTSGLPYPDPSDPVAGGADAIRALAEALDPASTSGWNARHIDDNATNGRAYFGTSDRPLDTSVMGSYIGLSPDTDQDSRRYAFWVTTGGGNGSVLFAVNKDATISSATQPYSSSVGRFNTSAIIPAGTYADYTITFPSGRFRFLPVVTMTGTSVYAILSHQKSVTVSGMTVRVFANGGDVPSGMAVHWHAHQFNYGSTDG